MKEAAWGVPARWREVCAEDGCPICRAGEPQNVIAEAAATWVTAPAEAPLPGYACVVSKLHVVEPFELPERASASFWAEAMVAARVLAELTGAVKLNYGIHGNVIPHLHLHLWPRYVDDPYDTGGIPVGAASFTRSEDDISRLAAAFRRGYADAGRR